MPKCKCEFCNAVIPLFEVLKRKLSAEDYKTATNILESMMVHETDLDFAQGKISALELAIENAGMEVSPCRECGEPVVCVPDGLGTFCHKCEELLRSQEEQWRSENSEFDNLS